MTLTPYQLLQQAIDLADTDMNNLMDDNVLCKVRVLLECDWYERLYKELNGPR